MSGDAMKIIDAHAHLGHRPRGLDALVESGVFEQIWLMDLSGCPAVDVRDLATREEVLEVAGRYDGFFLAFGFVDLDEGAPGDVDRLRDLGFVGLKPYKPRFPWGDERYFPFYERAERLGMPVLFHTGLVARGLPHGRGRPHGYGPDNMRPCHLAGVAEAFPDLTVLSGHMGYPHLEETWHNLYYYPNIYMDVSGYARSIDTLREALDRRAHDGTDRYFNDKILFSTDTCYGYDPDAGHARALRLASFWQLYFEFVGGLYYRWGRPEEKVKIFRDNARNLGASFGKPPGERL